MRKSLVWMVLILSTAVVAGHALGSVALAAFANSRSEGRACCSPTRGVISSISIEFANENVGSGENWIQYMAHAVTWDGGWESGPLRVLEYGRMLSGNPSAARGWHDYVWVVDGTHSGGAYFPLGSTVSHFEDRYQVYYSDIFCASLGLLLTPPCYNFFLDGTATFAMNAPEWSNGHDRAFAGLQVVRSGSPSPFAISGDFVDNKFATFPVAGTTWNSYSGSPPGVSSDMSWTSTGSDDWHAEGCAPGGCPVFY